MTSPASPPTLFDTPTIRTRRLPRCAGCALPPPLCLCAELPALATRTRVVLLMHHVERRKTSNTGRLLERALPGALVRVRGERGAPPPPPLPEGRRLLLFPDPSTRARVLSPELVAGEDALLLVPDGTWGQAQRISQRDADARSAVPVRLPPGPPSRYGLRRNPRAGTVSTFEAVARALGVLEGPAVEASLMEIFDRFIERALRVRTHGEGIAETCAQPGA